MYRKIMQRDPDTGEMLHRVGCQWLPLEDAIDARDEAADDYERRAELAREREEWIGHA